MNLIGLWLQGRGWGVWRWDERWVPGGGRMRTDIFIYLFFPIQPRAIVAAAEAEGGSYTLGSFRSMTSADRCQTSFSDALGYIHAACDNRLFIQASKLRRAGAQVLTPSTMVPTLTVAVFYLQARSRLWLWALQALFKQALLGNCYLSVTVQLDSKTWHAYNAGIILLTWSANNYNASISLLTQRVFFDSVEIATQTTTTSATTIDYNHLHICFIYCHAHTQDQLRQQNSQHG